MVVRCRGVNTAGTVTGTVEEFEQGPRRRLNEGGLQVNAHMKTDMALSLPDIM